MSCCGSTSGTRTTASVYFNSKHSTQPVLDVNIKMNHESSAGLRRNENLPSDDDGAGLQEDAVWLC